MTQIIWIYGPAWLYILAGEASWETKWTDLKDSTITVVYTLTSFLFCYSYYPFLTMTLSSSK